MMRRGLFWAVRLLLVVVAVGAVREGRGGLFGESEEEKAARVAKHVADVLREPKKLIAQAQDAAEAGQPEEAIRLFSQAHDMLVAVEEREDTSGAAFGTLRIFKARCRSMLDALALQLAEVQDVRQAVTDTSDLEAQLAAERKALLEKDAAERGPVVPDHPPTLREQLVAEEAERVAAAKQVDVAQAALVAAKQAVTEAASAFTKASQAHAAADAAAYVATQAVVQAQTRAQQAGTPAAAEALAAAQAEAGRAKEALSAAKVALEAAKQGREQARLELQVAERAELEARQKQVAAARSVEVLQRAIAEEEAAERAAAEAEERRLEAAQLAKRQATAAALQRERAALKQGEAPDEADERARRHEQAMCLELWRDKRLDELEPRLLAAVEKWPDDPALLVLLARLRLLNEEADDALELAEDVPAGGEPGRQARLVAAGVYLMKNRPMEAMKVLEGLMREQPNDPAPYFNMAVTLLRLPEIDPDREVAAQYYTKSVQLGGRRSGFLERRLNMEE